MCWTQTTDVDAVQGNLYAPYGPNHYNGRGDYFPRPQSLTMGDKYYERSKPQYESSPASAFLSARAFGAAGDGVTDDTQALNALFQAASGNYSAGAIAFLDAGYYKVSDTVLVPPSTRIVGEALVAVILGYGAKFAGIDTPYPVLKIGNAGDIGYVEVSDMIVSTQGAAAGAVLIEYNLNSPAAAGTYSPSNPPSGLWDVHTRIGGFAGSVLQLANCPLTQNNPNYVNPACIAAHTSMHITASAANVYVENNWLWVADHDIEDPNNTQITVFAGRGVLVESTAGRVWLVATASEHHALYQYQLVNTQAIFLGHVQTESPYYQPNPPAPAPFVNLNASISDPDFTADCASVVYGDNSTATNSSNGVALPGNPPCAMAWGLRIIGSKDVVVYGAGLYSFFNNNDVSCSTVAMGENCQARILWVGPNLGTGSGSAPGKEAEIGDVVVYGLNTVGTVSMVTRQGEDVALWSDNLSTFAQTLLIFKF
jgi:glucan 1,3-beta-glucosidase